MKIALDYDGTFTLDPGFWFNFIAMAQNSGHEVAVVTKRYPKKPELVDILSCRVIYTERRSKLYNDEVKEFSPDIWIDNNPFDITGYPIRGVYA